MLFLPTFSPGFFAAYIAGGMTDAIDGAVARRTGTESESGSEFDTVADIVFAASALVKIVPELDIPAWLWIWVCAIAAVKIASMAYGFAKEKKLVSDHSMLNKATGLLVFLLPLTVPFVDALYTAAIVCAVATVAAVTESYRVFARNPENQAVRRYLSGPGSLFQSSGRCFSEHRYRGHRMRANAIVLFAVLVLAASAAIVATDSSYAEDPVPETREVDFYDLAAEIPVKVPLKYYSDMPNVPYIGIAQLYKLYQPDREMTIIPGNDGKYWASSHDGSAVFDLAEGTVHSENYRDFVDLSLGEDYEDSPLLKEIYTKHEGSTAVTVRLSDYGLRMYYLEGDIYMPVAAAANLFSSGAGFAMMYLPGDSGIAPSLNSFNFTLPLDSPHVLTPPVLKGMMAMGDSGVRDPGMAEVAYGCLCMVMDNFYGKVSTSELGSMLKTRHLDDVLSSSDDINLNKIGGWLKSTSMAEYIAGLVAIDEYLYDGGHTMLALVAYLFLDEEAFPELAAAIRAELDTLQLPEHPDKDAKEAALAEARDAAWEGAVSVGGGDTYYSRGDTAVFTFDNFAVDNVAWKEYVPGSTDYPDDTIGHFVRALKKAQADPAIENFVIDVSTNEGGKILVVAFILAAITGDYVDLRVLDVQTGEVAVERILVDTNLDGRFDDEDLRKNYGFNFAILSTGVSFSSGNILPVYAKEDGIMVIGERSGGGTCTLMLGSSADGLFASYSSFSAIANKDGEDIEAGAAPDLVLIDQYTTDYSVLYDIDAISEAMNDFYKHEDGNALLYGAIAVSVIVAIAAVLLIRKRGTS